MTRNGSGAGVAQSFDVVLPPLDEELASFPPLPGPPALEFVEPPLPTGVLPLPPLPALPLRPAVPVESTPGVAPAPLRAPSTISALQPTAMQAKNSAYLAPATIGARA
jgi:hypothetical protein